MFLFLLSISSTVQAVPLPQSLTLKEFRSEGSRSLDTFSNFVIVSPSYRKVRRQGRKGESLPIKFPTLKVRDPNELNFVTNQEEQADSGPVFANSNNLDTEDIESKISDINDAIETKVPNAITATEIIPTQKEIVQTSQDDSNVLFGSPTLENEEANKGIEEGNITESDGIVAPKKRLVVSVKTFNQLEHLNEENIRSILETISNLKTSVYLNQDNSAIEKELNKPGKLIYVDANVDSSDKISGNVFADGRPLENLEGVEYEEALSILNQISQIIEESLAGSTENENSVVGLSKKIIVAIRTTIVISEETILRIKNSLKEAAEDTVVFVNAPEEVIRNEFSKPILPIFLSVYVDDDNLVVENVYYNSIPLENLNQAESKEASGILVTVTNLLEKYTLNPEIQDEGSPISITNEEMMIPKKVVISLKSSLIISEEESALLSSLITNRVEIPSILLVNNPADRIQAELSGPAVPILLDMNIDQKYQLSGNIFYNYQPLENIGGEQLDEAVNILTVVKETLTDKINDKLMEQPPTTEESKEHESEETITETDISVKTVNTKLEEPDQTKADEEDGEAVPEPSSEPEPTLTKDEEEDADLETSSEPQPKLTGNEEEDALSDPTSEPEPKFTEEEIRDEAQEPTPEPESDEEKKKSSPDATLESVKNTETEGRAEAEKLEVAGIEEVGLSVTEPIIETESLYLEQNVDDERSVSSDIEEGSGYLSSVSFNLEEIPDSKNVLVEVFNHGEKGVTEVPGGSKSATPGVDFGLIQEITSY